MKAYKGVPRLCRDCLEETVDVINCPLFCNRPSKALCVQRDWMARHPRFRINFAPKKAPWLIRLGKKLLDLYSRHGYCCGDTGGCGLTF